MLRFDARLTSRRGLRLETLEDRCVMSTVITVPLDSELDQFGDQILTVQAYGDASRATMGIFDTGASVVAFGAEDQTDFTDLGMPIPIKVAGGAFGDGIGGSVRGDVSAPGTILVDGFHAFDLNFDDQGFPDFSIKFTSQSASTPGIQAFIGTDSGSPGLPTISGTPILNPSPSHPNGLAASIDMHGELLDFSDIIPGLVLPMPDLHFVEPGTVLAPKDGTTPTVTIAMQFYGGDNHAAPGNVITESYNPVAPNVTIVSAGGTLSHQTFLFDTGSQLTVISTAEALALGLDLSNPETTITVTGVGGDQDIPGFTVPEIDLPTTDGGTVRYTNVPVYVLDVAPGIDGILGMNLFNTASEFRYDPFNAAGPRLSMNFFTDPDRGLGDFGNLGQAFGALFGPAFAGAFGGQNIPGLINNQSGAAPPKVQSAQVNEGAVQRSMDTSLTVTFNQFVNLPTDPSAAFELARLGPNGPNGDVNLTASIVSRTSTQTVVRLTFGGSMTDHNSLVDGNYQLTVFGSQVTNSTGRAMDGDGNGIAGGNYGMSLHRLFGDMNGDRVVNGADLTPLISAFGSSLGNPAFLSGLDMNGDGVINGADLSEFIKHFGMSL